jgi:hypothetical protein
MYSLTSPANLQPRFNICPTDTVELLADAAMDKLVAAATQAKREHRLTNFRPRI